MQIQVNTDSNIERTKALSGEVETVIQHALGRFSERITRVMVNLSDENSRAKSGETDKRCVIEARLGGLRPITVSHHGSTLDQALGGAADKLAKTLKRTVERRTSLLKRGAQQRAEWTAAAPVLTQDVETGKHEDFIQMLRPLLDHLRDHARRELRIMEAHGAANTGRINVADVLDELVARAWLQFATRPQSMALDLWLTKVLDEILEEHAQQGEPIQRSLDEPSREAPPQSIPQADDQEWWVALLGEDEEPAPGIEAVSRQSAWAEEFLEAEELVHRIHTLLSALPKQQRQAFVLHVLEGFELFEIGMLQDRPETNVRGDLETARRILGEQLRTGSVREVGEEGAKS